MAGLSQAELDEISVRLEAGMTPKAIAESISRMADLDEEDELIIEAAAIALAEGKQL